MYAVHENIAVSLPPLECVECGYEAAPGDLPTRCPKCGHSSFQPLAIAHDVLLPKRCTSLQTRSLSDVCRAWKAETGEKISRTLAWNICRSAEEKLREGLLRLGIELPGKPARKSWMIGLFGQVEPLPTRAPKRPRSLFRRVRDCIGQMRLF